MKKQLMTLTTLGLLSAALLFPPASMAAEEKKSDTPAAEKSGEAKPEKKPRAIPFRGKLAAVDKTASTFTVGERTFQVTADTKITRQGTAATLADAVVGENVTGSYLKGADGKLNAASVRLGVKTKSTEAEAEKSKPEKPGKKTTSEK